MVRRFRKKSIKPPDYRFVITLGLIILVGLIMLSSASAPTGYERFGDTYHFLKHQIFTGVIPGIILITLFSLIDYRFWRQWAFPMLLISIGLLLLVFIPGIGAEYGSAKSWIIVGNISFQPAELVKLTFLIYLATWIESRGSKKLSDFSEGLLPFLFSVGLIAFLMLMQPDMGTLSIILFMSLAVYFVAGASISHLFGVGAAGILGLWALIKVSPYRAARLTTFLHPELDPQGIGYHINQAFLAIGSGGFWGRGFGLSRQKYQYLPEVIGDSIFAIIAEELGFIFSVALVGGFVYLMYRGYKIAEAAPDMFGKLIVTGIISWFSIQAFVNIGAMVGILPLTGVPLPFISQGGTALAVAMAAAGIVINVSRQARLQ